jgi:RNA polymerase subunit RPABC4/transcription elongation factor Spt4
MKYCNTCGNEINNTQTTCPYCEAKQNITKPRPQKLVIVNLEKGKPLAHDALEKLENEIRKNISLGVKALKVIHGYGSSGQGGVIREKVIKRLNTKKQNGHIKHFYHCDFQNKNIDDFQIAVQLCPDLKEQLEKDRKNKGVSYIIL